MKYLESKQYYIDRYDLHTIEECLDAIQLFEKTRKQIATLKQLQDVSEEEKERSFNYITNIQLLNITIRRYKNKAKQIKKWMDQDSLSQDKYDNTAPPKDINCNDCKEEMFVTMKILDDFSSDKMRMLFTFKCDKCNSRKGIYEDGTVYKSRKHYCEECGAELNNKFKYEKDKTTWISKCTKCDFLETEVTDEKEHKEKEKKERERKDYLLEKYRNDFCLNKEDAEKKIEMLEEIKFANQVYEHELEKYSEPAFAQSLKIKMIKIADLTKSLMGVLKKNGYTDLSLDKPNIGKFVTVVFTVQDNSDREKRDSIKTLEKVLREGLEFTNWRLMSSGVSYRLGYLSGELRGYDNENEIIKMLRKKEVKVQKPLDQSKLDKYSISNADQLAKITAKIEAKQRARLDRFKKEPKGFVLEDHGQSYYSCNLCHRTIRGNETWWFPHGIVCLDCKKNIHKKVVPIEILENEKIWFDKSDLQDEYGLHYRTVDKLVRDGDLIPRVCKDSKNKPYFQVFMVEDNIDFFKNNERKMSSTPFLGHKV